MSSKQPSKQQQQYQQQQNNRHEQQTQYQQQDNNQQVYQPKILVKQISIQQSQYKLPIIHNNKRYNNGNIGKQEWKYGDYDLPQLKQNDEDNKRRKNFNIVLPSLGKQQQQVSKQNKQEDSQKVGEVIMKLEEKQVTNQKINKQMSKQSQQISEKQQQFGKEQQIDVSEKDRQNIVTAQVVSNNEPINPNPITEPPQTKQLVIRPALQTELQKITSFAQNFKSSTILFQDLEHSSAFQSQQYYQNHKLILTQPIISLNSICKFRIENIKYCIGFGVGLKQVIIKHEYDYQSEGNQQLGHGLYIITSQGFSWSHSQKNQDDILRVGFNQMYNGLEIEVRVFGEEIQFKWKKGQFKLTLPTIVRQKYTVCFCAYLHEKQDALSICQ